jgi:hypothetical protein
MRGANLCTIGVQIGCNRGCKTRRNAGFRAKGRGFESISLQRRVRKLSVPLDGSPAGLRYQHHDPLV